MSVSTVCDICGEKASVTYEVYTHLVGHRPILGLHNQTLRMAAPFIDRCDKHRLLEVTAEQKAKI